MNILARITGIKYKPLLCRKLETFDFEDIATALSNNATFILNIDRENKVAVSWWVSAKRTRSYPYARVYDSLGFAGKKITIIPIVKDEGKEGDRDFLQWDTVSLMSLLGVYVIISYYKHAERSARYRHKITNQAFDIEYTKSKIKQLLSYQSDALHWNIEQIGKVGEVGQKALEAYLGISKRLGVDMHSEISARRRIDELLKSKEEFMAFSRGLAEKAHERERLTTQPKEKLSGRKATITIRNYLGGYYYFTADEAKISEREVYLVEGKHSRTNSLPSLGDIKDGLFKMILFTNLEEVKVGDAKYNPTPILKLTVEKGFSEKNISESQKKLLDSLEEEAKLNGFQVVSE
jgi:hypothetical protein